MFAAAVLTEAALSFLGVGVPPYVPSWGVILAEGRLYIQQAPWLVIYPGLAIMLTIFGLNLFGDGLRDLLDPKIRGLATERQRRRVNRRIIHAATSSRLSSDRHGHSRRRRLRASAGLDGRHPDAAGRGQRRRRRRRRRLHAERRRAVHVRHRRHRAHARLPRRRRATRPRLRRAGPARGRSREVHGGRAGGRTQIVRDAGQSWRLADRARALRPAAAGGGARAGHRARRARRAAHLQERRVLHRRTGQPQAVARSRAPLLAQRRPAGRRRRDLQGSGDHVPAGGRGRHGRVLSRPRRQGHRAHGRGGRRLAVAGRPGGLPSRVARARAHHVSRARGRLDAGAVLGVPDARDAEHPRGLRPEGLGPQLGGLPPPSDRGDQARLGRPAGLRVW